MFMHGPGALIEIMIRQFQSLAAVYRFIHEMFWLHIRRSENKLRALFWNLFFNVLQSPRSFCGWQIPPDNSKISSLEREKKVLIRYSLTNISGLRPSEYPATA